VCIAVKYFFAGNQWMRNFAKPEKLSEVPPNAWERSSKGTCWKWIQLQFTVIRRMPSFSTFSNRCRL